MTCDAGTLDNKWYKASVNVQEKAPYKLLFTGVRGLNYQGDIALDDISLFSGRCFSSQCKFVCINSWITDVDTIYSNKYVFYIEVCAIYN